MLVGICKKAFFGVRQRPKPLSVVAQLKNGMIGLGEKVVEIMHPAASHDAFFARMPYADARNRQRWEANNLGVQRNHVPMGSSGQVSGRGMVDGRGRHSEEFWFVLDGA